MKMADNALTAFAGSLCRCARFEFEHVTIQPLARLENHCTDIFCLDNAFPVALI